MSSYSHPHTPAYMPKGCTTCRPKDSLKYIERYNFNQQLRLLKNNEFGACTRTRALHDNQQPGSCPPVVPIQQLIEQPRAVHKFIDAGTFIKADISCMHDLTAQSLAMRARIAF